MTIERPDLISLPSLINPTREKTLFLVRDSAVDQTLTVERVASLLNTKGLRGPTGPSGPIGSVGPQGNDGFSGTSGYSGISGESGPIGYSGVSGQEGLSGYSGVSGQEGLSGYSGQRGEASFSGYSGTSGFSGEKGDTGPTGPSGPAESKNLQGGESGSLLIQSSSGNTTFIPPGVIGNILQSQGTTATWVNASEIISGKSNLIYLNTLTNSVSVLYPTQYPMLGRWPGDYVPASADSNFYYTGQGSAAVLSVPNIKASGDITLDGTVNQQSDSRVKENIVTVDYALEKTSRLRGVYFNKLGQEKRKIGVIAQEIREVLPEVVSQDEEGMLSVEYGNIVGLLIESIKELREEILELKKNIPQKYVQ